jgi:hypothetical protein
MHELLYQALETEIGGQLVYEASVRAAVNDELRDEWKQYLDETRNHEKVLRELFEELGLDAETASPGREVVRSKAHALVAAIETAMKSGKDMAQLVAAESVVEAETKDHQNWELIGMVAEHADKKTAAALMKAYEQVEEEEDEHLYHTMGWARELWAESLGIPAVLPPPEEEKDVKTAIGAARAKNSRDEMLGKSEPRSKKK